MKTYISAVIKTRDRRRGYLERFYTGVAATLLRPFYNASISTDWKDHPYKSTGITIKYIALTPVLWALGVVTENQRILGDITKKLADRVEDALCGLGADNNRIPEAKQLPPMPEEPDITRLLKSKI
jgi:hypothetical protein